MVVNFHGNESGALNDFNEIRLSIHAPGYCDTDDITCFHR